MKTKNSRAPQPPRSRRSAKAMQELIESEQFRRVWADMTNSELEEGIRLLQEQTYRIRDILMSRIKTRHQAN